MIEDIGKWLFNNPWAVFIVSLYTLVSSAIGLASYAKRMARIATKTPTKLQSILDKLPKLIQTCLVLLPTIIFVPILIFCFIVSIPMSAYFVYIIVACCIGIYNNLFLYKLLPFLEGIALDVDKANRIFADNNMKDPRQKSLD